MAAGSAVATGLPNAVWVRIGDNAGNVLTGLTDVVVMMTTPPISTAPRWS